VIALLLAAALATATDDAPPPNVVLMMADDLGWGDLGCYGGDVIETPHLDQMAEDGVRFERFYAAAPVCSPTRGSFLTGRHPYRFGVTGANTGHLPKSETTIAELLREEGYRTGFFGKWHLGTLTKDVVDSNRGGRPKHEGHYSPPWEHGFDVTFATEAKVPTFDPMVKPGTGNPEEPYGTAYWRAAGETVVENVSGDDSRVIMDRALPFVEEAIDASEPFLAVIWFHAPHLPTVASEEDLARYEHLPEESRAYAGCVTALDREVGRLRARLDELGVADDTLVFFCSDNGPEGKAQTDARPGSTGGLSGRKRSLREGGVRVPGLLVWPAGEFVSRRIVNSAASTSDLLPTVLDATRLPRPDAALDGIALQQRFLLDAAVIRGGFSPYPIGFVHRRQAAWTAGRWKAYSADGGETFALHDLKSDPAEVRDLSAEEPELLALMCLQWKHWHSEVTRER